MHIDAHSHAAPRIVVGQAAGPVVGAQDEHGAYVLYFQSFFHACRDLEFPCDSHGHVDLDAMSEMSRNNYLYARAMIGREVSWPSVRRMSETRMGLGG